MVRKAVRAFVQKVRSGSARRTLSRRPACADLCRAPADGPWRWPAGSRPGALLTSPACCWFPAGLTFRMAARARSHLPRPSPRGSPPGRILRLQPLRGTCGRMPRSKIFGPWSQNPTKKKGPRTRSSGVPAPVAGRCRRFLLKPVSRENPSVRHRGEGLGRCASVGEKIAAARSAVSPRFFSLLPCVQIRCRFGRCDWPACFFSLSRDLPTGFSSRAFLRLPSR